MKLAFADAYAYVSDPATMQLAPDALLDSGYLAARANQIDAKRAQTFQAGEPLKAEPSTWRREMQPA